MYARRDDNQFDEWTYIAHHTGVNTISYANQPTALQNTQQQQQHMSIKLNSRFVSGGCDNKLRIWHFDFASNQFIESGIFNTDIHHSDWIRDVAWAPSMGLPSNIIASCSDDNTVCIWIEDSNTQVWNKVKTLNFNDKIYKLSWSVMGNILAVAQADNVVTLWKEDTDGSWIQISGITETGQIPDEQLQQPQSQMQLPPQQQQQQQQFQPQQQQQLPQQPQYNQQQTPFQQPQPQPPHHQQPNDYAYQQQQPYASRIQA